MIDPDTYKTVRQPSSGVYKEKGSRFLAFVFPVSDENGIRELLTKIKKEHHSARHHCYAWRLENEEYRVNDDGEPSGTAGRPIFNQIRSNDLSNILVIVVRYFGGILLGTSGLTNAYRSAAADALMQADIIEQIREDLIEVNFDYSVMNEYMQLIKEMHLKQVSTDFRLDCSALIAVRKSQSEMALNKLNNTGKIRAFIKQNNHP